MPTDPTVLAEAAQSVLDVLVEGANETGWDPPACVTVGEPAVSCDSILVWVSSITPLFENKQPGCQIATEVTLSFFLASCIGGDLHEDCEWWDERTPGHLDRIWPVWINLVEAVLSDSLCVGVTCADVTLNELVPVSAGEFGLWQGSVQIVLSPRAGS